MKNTGYSKFVEKPAGKYYKSWRTPQNRGGYDMAYTTFKLPIGYRLYDREQNKVVPLNQEEYESLERI